MVDEQAELNAGVWARGDFVKSYAGHELKRVEVVLLERNRLLLAGRVLELGCGGGRLTGHLIPLASHVHGLDIAPAMVDHCRRAYPEAAFSVTDVRDLSAFDGASFDAVLAPGNVLDVLGDAERRRVLGEIARILSAGGLLIVSSHNLAYAPRIEAPTHIARPAAISPRAILAAAYHISRIPLRVRNRRRLRPLERFESDHAILVDCVHDYALLHYYISRDAQERQLAAAGLELIECLDLDGQLVEAGAQAGDSPELHYAARLSTGASPRGGA